MREILFRAKSAFGNDWVYGYLTSGNDCVGRQWFISSPAKDPDDHNHFARIYKETVGQFTGLTDKNGTKIFEGDIVKLTDKNNNYEWTAVVEFGNPNSYYSWGWQLKPITKNVEYNLDILCWIDMDDVGVSCEVIGNIYDNPELLKEARYDD